MDVAYISALSALAGSFVGGLTSGIASWLSQRAAELLSPFIKMSAASPVPFRGSQRYLLYI
jgi:hypothetical protein